MEKLALFFKEYKWTITCAILALICVILIFTINFWRTLILAVVVAIGIIVGLALDKKGSLKKLFEKDR